MHSKNDVKEQIGTHIEAYTQARLRESATLTKRMRDVSHLARKGLDTIKFPSISGFVVQNRAMGVAGNKQDASLGMDKLELDQNAYISWGVDGSLDLQSQLTWGVECATLASEVHVDSLEARTLTVIESKAIPVDITVEKGKNVTVKTFTSLRKKLRDAKVPLAQALFIIPTSVEEEILSNPEILKVAGFGQALIENGEIKKIYGVEVEVRVGATQVSALYTQAVVYGFQKGVSYAEQPDIAYGTNGKAAAMDQLYGVGCTYIIPTPAENPPANAGKCAVIFTVGDVTDLNEEEVVGD